MQHHAIGPGFEFLRVLPGGIAARPTEPTRSPGQREPIAALRSFLHRRLLTFLAGFDDGEVIRVVREVEVAVLQQLRGTGAGAERNADLLSEIIGSPRSRARLAPAPMFSRSVHATQREQFHLDLSAFRRCLAQDDVALEPAVSRARVVAVEAEREWRGFRA